MLNKFYLELVRYKAYADLRAETKKTYIGVLWWVFDPIIFMFIFYLVFGVLLQRGTEDYVSFLLVGLVAWRWFQNTVAGGANSIQAGQALMRQVHLPKVIFPLVSVLTDLFKFSLVFVLLLLYLWISGHSVTTAYLALPVLLLVQLGLIVSTTCFVAALVPVLPDLRHLVIHLLHLMFFVSGIFFSVDMIPEQYRVYFYLNPMATLLDAFRDVLLYSAWPNWIALSYVVSFSAVIALITFYILHRLEFEYPKLITR